MPIAKKSEDRSKVMEYTETLAKELREKYYHHRKIQVEIDDRDVGGRGWDWIKKGIPVRVEIGPRDIADNSVFVGTRDKEHKDRTSLKRDQFVAEITNILDEIQDTLFQRALAFREKNTIIINDNKQFYDLFTPENQEKPEIHGGFALSHWCGSEACESKIKEDLSVTIRCIPFDNEAEKGNCICCGRPALNKLFLQKPID